MLSFPLWFLILLAVVFFWAVGAYNRLVRLRAAIHKAFAALDEQLFRQQVWIQGNLPAHMRGAATAPLELQDATTAAWARLQAASDQFTVVLAQARARPIDADQTAALVLAHEAMRTAWVGVLQEAIPHDAVPSAERLQERWMRLLHQSLPLRTAFNDAAQAYNRAIAQFPASLLARLVGFRPAGSLTRLAEGR